MHRGRAWRGCSDASDASFAVRLELVIERVTEIFFVVECVVVASTEVGGTLQTQRTDAVEIVETLEAVGGSTDASSARLERQTAAGTSSTDETLEGTAAAAAAATGVRARAATAATGALQRREKPRRDAIHEAAVHAELSLAISRTNDRVEQSRQSGSARHDHGVQVRQARLLTVTVEVACDAATTAAQPRPKRDDRHQDDLNDRQRDQISS